VLAYRSLLPARVAQRTFYRSLLGGVLTALYIGLLLLLEPAANRIIQTRSQLPLVTIATIIVLIAIFGPLRDWAGAWIDRRFFHREFDYGRLLRVLGGRSPLVLDADALTLIGASIGRIKRMRVPPVLTPHEGEFRRLFGDLRGSKIDQAREAAQKASAIIIFKGPDTVVAAPDGRVAVAMPGPSWLASAGTGDVLAGVVAAMVAQGLDGFEAAQAAVWLHAEASRLAGPALIADDLVNHLPQAIAACL